MIVEADDQDNIGFHFPSFMYVLIMCSVHVKRKLTGYLLWGIYFHLIILQGGHWNLSSKTRRILCACFNPSRAEQWQKGHQEVRMSFKCQIEGFLRNRSGLIICNTDLHGTHFLCFKSNLFQIDISICRQIILNWKFDLCLLSAREKRLKINFSRNFSVWNSI